MGGPLTFGQPNRPKLRCMDLDRTLLQIGGSPVTLLHLLLVTGLFALLLLIAAVILSWRAQASRAGEAIATQRRTAELEYRIAELSGALKSLVEQSQGSQIQMVATLDERLDQVTERLGLSLIDQTERTGQSLKQLHERLAVI